MALDAVDLLIVTETIEILNAFLAVQKDEWTAERLTNGVRYHRLAFTAAPDQGRSLIALVTIDRLSEAIARETTSQPGRPGPRLTTFVGRGYGWSRSFKPGDVLFGRRIEPDAPSANDDGGVLAQEARYFEQSPAWRIARLIPESTPPGHSSIHWGAVARRTELKYPRSLTDGTLVALNDTSDTLLSVALTHPSPWLIVLGLGDTADPSKGVDPQWQSAPEPVVSLALATFVLGFFPHQIRLGNTRDLARPTQLAPPTDEDTAALLRELVDGLRVASVSISNFKNIESLTIDLRAAPSAKGHWTCIAGVNGAGKSAVLQAVVIALLGDGLARELGGEWLKRTRRLHEGAHMEASVAVTVSTMKGATDLRVALGATGIDDDITKDPAYSQMRRVWKARAEHHILRAYGPGRNLSEHLDNRYGKNSPDVQAVMTLFDPLTQVASAETLVEKTPDPDFLRHLTTLVRHVFRDFAIDVVTEGSALRFTMQGALLPVTDLPDGFRATLAWLADLCLAWFQSASTEDRAVGIATLRATVLIDEVDLHLHPKLQRTLVPRLREILPEVQWIVTTHSPLVLACFERSEIVMLQPDATHGVRQRVLDRQIMGFTLDEIVAWLMETPPRSVALEELAKTPTNADDRLAFLLTQSPSISEADAATVMEVVRQRRQEDREDADGSPDVEVPPKDHT